MAFVLLYGTVSIILFFIAILLNFLSTLSPKFRDAPANGVLILAAIVGAYSAFMEWRDIYPIGAVIAIIVLLYMVYRLWKE